MENENNEITLNDILKEKARLEPSALEWLTKYEEMNPDATPKDVVELIRRGVDAGTLATHPVGDESPPATQPEDQEGEKNWGEYVFGK